MFVASCRSPNSFWQKARAKNPRSSPCFCISITKTPSMAAGVKITVCLDSGDASTAPRLEAKSPTIALAASRDARAPRSRGSAQEEREGPSDGEPQPVERHRPELEERPEHPRRPEGRPQHEEDRHLGERRDVDDAAQAQEPPPDRHAEGDPRQAGDVLVE